MNRFIKNGHVFEIKKTGKTGVRLSYEGKEKGFHQGYIWICDDEAEAMDMVEAIIDTERFPDDEYKARHIKEFTQRYKW